MRPFGRRLELWNNGEAMEFRIRRARWTDYRGLATLAGWPGVDGDERRSIRLFRKVVADLGCDPYVAESPSGVVGFVSVHYTRVIALGGSSASIEDLVAAPGFSPSPLLAHARRRAGQRSARRLCVASGVVDHDLLARAGFERREGIWVLVLEERE